MSVLGNYNKKAQCLLKDGDEKNGHTKVVASTINDAILCAYVLHIHSYQPDRVKNLCKSSICAQVMMKISDSNCLFDILLATLYHILTNG